MTLNEEAARATDLFRGKIVKSVVRHRQEELLIEFEDGSRILADGSGPLELSIELRD